MHLSEEKEIMHQISLGGIAAENAFRVLVNTYSRILYRSIRRMTGDHESTNDILQNTWIKVWKYAGNFKGDSSVLTWTYSISRNETLNYLKSQKRHSSVSLDPVLLEVIPGHATLDRFRPEEVQRLLQRAIDALPEKQALVFQLRYFDEMKFSEISQLLGTSEGALKASYSIARSKIEEFFSSL